jgi:hypothetical protein
MNFDLLGGAGWDIYYGQKVLDTTLWPLSANGSTSTYSLGAKLNLVRKPAQMVWLVDWEHNGVEWLRYAFGSLAERATTGNLVIGNATQGGVAIRHGAGRGINVVNLYVDNHAAQVPPIPDSFPAKRLRIQSQ